MSRPLRATLGVLGTAAVLAGCGGDDPSSAVLDRDASLHLTLTDYRIDPPVVRVRATSFPARVRITIRNEGRLVHTVKVLSIPPDGAQGVGRKPINFGGAESAQPGQTASSQQDVLLQPGTYRLSCTISNHDNLGQYGTLIVDRAR